MLGRWPLVGRDSELLSVQKLWREQRQSLVIAGPGGVGKTHFARACLDEARSRGWPVEVLLAPRAAGLRARDDTGTVMQTLLGHLEMNGVLFVDDAHLLGDDEAALLHDTASRGRAVVIAAVASGYVPPTDVTALWKNDIAARIELGPLDEDHVSHILSAVLAAPVDRGTVASFAERCDGSAVYLRDLVLGALADGSLRETCGLWRLTGDLRPSARLVELVDAELRGVVGEDRRLLEIVAYAEPVDHGVLSSVADPIALERLEREQHLVTRRTGDSVQVCLRRRVHRDVLRARTPVARTQAIARELLAVSTQPGDALGNDALQLATWSLDARSTAPANLLAAATTARWRYDFALAERLVTSAVLAGAGFEAELLAAQLASLQGRNTEAERQLVDLQGRADTDTRRGHVAITRLDNLALYQGDIELGLRVAEEAEACITDRGWRDHVGAVKVGLLIAARGPRAAAEAAEPLLASASGAALIRACQGGAYSFGRTGQIAQALRASTLGLAAHRDLDEPTEWYPWFHLLTRCMALAQAGRLIEAEDEARAQHSKGIAEGSAEAQAFFCWHLAKVVGERGHITDAAHYGRQGIALFRELGRPQYARESQLAVALALALAGRGTEAQTMLRELDGMDLPPTPYTATELPIAQGWTHAARGDLRAAAEALRGAADLGIRIGDLAGATSALHAIARLGHAADVVDELAEISSAVEGDLSAARVAHVQALRTGSAGDLGVVATRFEAMGADLLAAEAAADHAEALLRGGHRRDSNAARGRALELMNRCAGAATPTLRRLDAQASLTRAEYEIALLAATGEPTSAIAGRLKLSVRTVQNHLQHAYEKLGIHKRDQLTGALQSEAVQSLGNVP